MWPREHEFDALITAAAARHDVPAPLIQGTIGAESGFDPLAYRAEPAINDGSYGLMQVLFATARGMGYPGVALGLYDPATSIDLGTRFLREMFARSVLEYPGQTYGHWQNAVSAYNGGWRPSIGYGHPIATGYANQSYVNKVMRYTRAFDGNADDERFAPVGWIPGTTTAAAAGPLWNAATITLCLAAAFALLHSRGH